MSVLKFKVAHLFPKLLNIYGDFGNIVTLKRRCEARKIDFELVEINEGDLIDIANIDFYFIGGGQDKQQEKAAQELQKHKLVLKEARDIGAVFLGICGGYQLFGHYYQPKDAPSLICTGLMNVKTVAADKRFIGNVTAHTSFLTPKTLVGFENHSGLTYLGEGVEPLAKIKIGNGNNGEDKTEGARYKNVFGTYLHGSLLPKNPHFADYLIELALRRHTEDDFALPKINDDIEYKAHFSMVNAKY